MARGRPPLGSDDDELAVPTKIRCAGCGTRFYGIATDRCFKCREKKRAEVAANACNDQATARKRT